RSRCSHRLARFRSRFQVHSPGRTPTSEHALRLEAIVFEHAFRLGQLYPAASATEETTRDPVLRRLARCATDMRSPPGQRLRVLLGAAMLAVEELYPPAASAG